MSSDSKISEPSAVVVRKLLVHLETLKQELGVATPKLLVAVSGGRDSMLLLHLLVTEVQAKGYCSVVVAHFDHQLRTGSGEDARLVAAAAAKYGLPFYTATPDRPKLPSENLEAWAREERYRFLERVRISTAADAIAVAHHRADQAETYLFRVLTGRVRSGIGAMQVWCPERKVFRPLLCIDKAEIAACAEACGLSWVEDESNVDVARTRNWLRHDLMPRLQEKMNPAIESVLACVAEEQTRDDKFLDALAFEQVEHFPALPEQAAFVAIPEVIRWRALRAFAELHIGETAKKIARHRYEQLAMELCSNAPQARMIELGFSVIADCSQGHVRIFSNLIVTTLDNVHLQVPGEVQFGNYKFRAQYHRDGATLGNEQLDSRLLLDADELGATALNIRSWSPGDTVSIPNRGRRKLKKLFQEQGLMLTLRNRVPIVEAESEVLWVPGVARTDLAQISQETRAVIEIVCSKH